MPYMNDLYISIADINIQLLFTHIRQNSVRNEFIKMVIDRYKNFISYSIKKKINCTITIKDDMVQSISLIPDGKKKSLLVFTKFYEKLSLGHLVTYYNISMFQFDKLLFQVFETLLFQHKGFLIQGDEIIHNGKSTLLLENNQKHHLLFCSLFVIRHVKHMKKKGGKFFCFTFPFMSHTTQNKGNPIEKIIYCSETIAQSRMAMVKRRQKYIEFVLKHTNIPKFINTGLNYSKDKNQIMHTYISFINTVELWHYYRNNQKPLDL